MRKALLTLIVGLSLVGIASALPTGPGGTFYFNAVGVSTQNLKLFYLDFDSAWTPLLTSNAVVNYATITDAPMSTPGSGVVAIKSQHTPMLNSTTGKYDMNGSYHNAKLLVAARYDNTPDVDSFFTGATGNYIGADLLQVQPDGTLVTLNHGMNCNYFGANRASHTASIYWAITVDSGFTPGGQTVGIASMANQISPSMWVDTDGDSYIDDVYGTGDAYGKKPLPTSLGNASNYPSETNTNGVRYLKTGQTIYGKTPTGVVMDWNGGTVVQSWRLAASTQEPNGTYFWITQSPVNAHSSYIPMYTTAGGVWTAGDTDGNGVLDVYYPTIWNDGTGTQFRLAHGTDKNQDGDWFDSTETKQMSTGTDTTIGLDTTLKDLELIKCSSSPNTWVLTWWQYVITSATAQSYYLKAIALDSNGDWDLVAPVTLLSYTVTTAGSTGDASLGIVPLGYGVTTANAVNARDLVWVPLNAPSPEPGTLLLLGTGVVGLAGVLRRRFIR